MTSFNFLRGPTSNTATLGVRASTRNIEKGHHHHAAHRVRMYTSCVVSKGITDMYG